MSGSMTPQAKIKWNSFKILRTCHNIRNLKESIIFFSLRYGRALEIIQDEEYLEASDFDEIRRHKRSDDKLKERNIKLNRRNRIKRQTTNGINKK